MCKYILTFCLGLIVSNYSFSQTKLYINLNSHNEETDFEGIGGNSSGSENSNFGYNNVSATYQTYRNWVKVIADTVVSKNIKWNFQSDWTFLQGCLNYDKGSMTSNTSGVTILKWLSDSTFDLIELDPHFHGSTHNIADVAWLYKLNGIEPSLNVGGFVYDAISGTMLSADWRNMKNGIKTEYYSFSSTNYTYTPNVLWGAAAANHVDDVRDYGVWRPKYMDFVAPKDSFYVDDPNELVFIGNGCSGGNDSQTHIIDATTHNAVGIYNDLKAMAENINNGGYPSGKFYSATIQMKQSEYNQAYVNELSQLVDSLNAYISKNPEKMEWDLLSEKKQIWTTVFNKDTNQLACGTAATTRIENINSDNKIDFRVFPNPSNGMFSLQLNNVLAIKKLKIEVYNVLGNKILSKNTIQDLTTIDLSHYRNGMYMCRIMNDNEVLAVQPLLILNNK